MHIIIFFVAKEHTLSRPIFYARRVFISFKLCNFVGGFCFFCGYYPNFHFLWSVDGVSNL